ncbi:hypothetical protein RUM44_009479 [Polyplax serrata]|uniref:Uncharacterized protein n=1 Tax=Polyplax serrata TaxID=468196 RepID=A0ABR1AUH9_POLSC
MKLPGHVSGTSVRNTHAYRLKSKAKIPAFRLFRTLLPVRLTKFIQSSRYTCDFRCQSPTRITNYATREVTKNENSRKSLHGGKVEPTEWSSDGNFGHLQLAKKKRILLVANKRDYLAVGS